MERRLFKKVGTLAGLLVLSTSFPLAALSQLPEMAYVRRVDSAVNSGYATSFELKHTSDCGDQTTAWYLDDRLIGIHTLQKNSLSDVMEVTYYVRNDTLVYCTQQQCRTISAQSTPEDRSDNVNDDRRPESRTNCLTVSLYLESQRIFQTIDGENVFEDQRRYQQEEAESLICYSALLNDIRKIK